MPPTDPRILAMTEEQIDLEYELILWDKAQKDGNAEAFEDDTFEDWAEETESVDERLSDPLHVTPRALPTLTEYAEEEWEPVE